MTDLGSPFLSTAAQELLRTLADLGHPTPVAELVTGCNPRPVTTTELDVLRGREREVALQRAVVELDEAGMVTQTPQKKGQRVISVVWLCDPRLRHEHFPGQARRAVGVNPPGAPRPRGPTRPRPGPGR